MKVKFQEQQDLKKMTTVGPPLLYALDGLDASLAPYPHADKIKPKTYISSMELDRNGAQWLCVGGARESYHFVSIDSKGEVTTFKKQK